MTQLRNRKPVTFDLKFNPVALAIDTDMPDGYVAGWASTAGINSFGYRVAPFAFQKAITKRGLEGPRAVKLLLDHNWERMAGKILELEYRNGDLWIEAQMNLEVGYVRDFYSNAKMLGGINFSVGFYMEDLDFVEEQTNVEIMHVTQGDLFEVSLVPFPADEDAMTEVLHSADNLRDDCKDLKDFEKHLVLEGIANNRSHAALLVEAAKKNAHLFARQNPPLTGDGDEDGSPRLEAELSKLSEALERLKAVSRNQAE